MRIQSVHLLPYRNFGERSFYFTDGLQVITGENGVGKTNLLEAVGYLSLGKSIRRVPDPELVQWGADFFLVEGTVERDTGATHRIKIRYWQGKKEAFLDGKRVEALRELFQVFPVVSATPLDQPVVEGEPEARRSFLDRYLGLLDPVYAQKLAQYRRALRQKNALLREGQVDTLAPWNRQLEQTGAYVVQRRTEMVRTLQEVLKNGRQVSLPREEVTLAYQPSLPLREGILDAYIEEEHERGVALYGPHRDQILFLYRGYPLEHVGSQGEKWLFLLTVLMGLRDLLAQHYGELPVLLLDEPISIFGESFVQKFVAGLEGQTLITSVHPVSIGTPIPI